MSKKKKSWPKKYLLIVATCIAIIAFLIGLLLLNDFFKFKSFKQSRYFGSKDTYSQSQSLYFDDIKVTVSEVEHTRIWVIGTSEKECSKKYPPKIVESTIAIYLGQSYRGDRYYDENQADRNNCISAIEKWKNRKNIVVHYYIENLKNEPISIGDYSARIDGSENIERNEPNSKITDLLANQSRYANFWVEVPFGSNDFALVITKDGKQKEIRIELPELTGSKIQ